MIISNHHNSSILTKATSKNKFLHIILALNRLKKSSKKSVKNLPVMLSGKETESIFAVPLKERGGISQKVVFYRLDLMLLFRKIFEEWGESKQDKEPWIIISK